MIAISRLHERWKAQKNCSKRIGRRGQATRKKERDALVGPLTKIMNELIAIRNPVAKITDGWPNDLLGVSTCVNFCSVSQKPTTCWRFNVYTLVGPYSGHSCGPNCDINPQHDGFIQGINHSFYDNFRRSNLWMTYDDLEH